MTTPASPAADLKEVTPATLLSQVALRQMALSTQAACLAIALLLSLIGGALTINLIYSFIIGNLCSAFINSGRLGLAWWMLRRPGPHPESLQAGWPGWPAMVPITVLGGSLGYAAGSLLAMHLTGHRGTVPTGDNWRGWAAIFVLSILASLMVTWYFYSRASLAAAEAAQQASARLAAQTQLKLLESQLEPHMLFNTLANLRALIGVDPERAQAMLDRLIDFLRATLSASRANWHPLQAEYDRVADYLALMQVRMGPRLSVRLDLPPALAQHPVPPLLLQPLVENAIRHGLEPLRRGGEIHLHAHTEAGRLVLCVDDSGQGLGASAPASPRSSNSSGSASTGFGTLQVRERLATLYGPSARLVIAPRPDGQPGTRAQVELPHAPLAA